MRLEAAGEALTPAEQQEEGRRQLVAIQGVGWERCRAIPGVSGRHCRCCRGKSRSFPFRLLGLSLEAAV